MRPNRPRVPGAAESALDRPGSKANSTSIMALPLAQRPVFWLSVVLAVVTVIIYLPAIGGGFIWDDDQYVTLNPHLQGLDGLVNIWVPTRTPQYYPLVFTTFWVERQIYGLNPFGYHLVNVALHIACAMLLRLLLRRIGLGEAIAWLTAFLFAFHPVHVESVAWITERKNVLSGACYLASALCFLRWADGDRLSGWRSQRELYAAALVLFVCALLSKTVTCSLPAALMLVRLWQRKPLSIRYLASLVPFFIIGFTLAMVTAHLERKHVGAEGVDFAFSLADRLLIASRALVFYPTKLAWPAELIFVYERWLIDATDWRQWLYVAGVVLVGIASLALFLRGRRGLPLALAFYAGTVFPALGFFNVYPMLFSFVADHFVYLASIGILVIIAYAAVSQLGETPWLHLCAAVVLSILAFATFKQASLYNDIETLWRRTIARNPDAWLARNNLAAELMRQATFALDRGDRAAATRLFTEADHHARASLEVHARNPVAHMNIAQASVLSGNPEAALPHVQAAIAATPELADPYFLLGQVYGLLKRDDEAIKAFQDGLKVAPGVLAFHIEIAHAHMRNERYEEAAEHFEIVLANQGDNYESLDNLSMIRAMQGRTDVAELLLKRAIEVARVNNRHDLVQSLEHRIREMKSSAPNH